MRDVEIDAALGDNMEKYDLMAEADVRLLEAQIALLNIGIKVGALKEIREEIRVGMRKMVSGL